MFDRRTLLRHGASGGLLGAAALAAPALIAPAALAAPAPLSVRVRTTSPRVVIQAMQHLLTAHGFTTTADGAYGPRTTDSVRAFQRSRGLVVDGIAGPNTMSALLRSSTSVVRASGSNAHAVRAAQRLLGRAGYATVVDGTLSSSENSAIASFQTAYQLTLTRIVDHLTWTYLFVLPAKPPSSTSPWTSTFLTADEKLAYLPRDSSGNLALDRMSTTTRENGRFLIAVGKGRGIPAKGIQVALATAMVESGLLNLYPTYDRDSGGLFQQRPSTGWGTYTQVRHKHLATLAFFGVAMHTPNPGLMDYWPTYSGSSIGTLAQKVQRSAYPSRYDAMADDALAFYNRYAAGVAPYRG
ncbi:peptidoglycan-binding protein [Brachybacterium sp. EF45031]|uniref:peptidoglycan-binding domain-containing protein n=1 Tax=Brachybacterium sillae TaxID=2810536 RepID=UPI00217D3C32|nr:peptidoglycan-binding protein [Brachybacterium sillae]MCS6712014.1 peptidoglycan-binding protein [Brachybacterium sillae]